MHSGKFAQNSVCGAERKPGTKCCDADIKPFHVSDAVSVLVGTRRAYEQSRVVERKRHWLFGKNVRAGPRRVDHDRSGRWPTDDDDNSIDPGRKHRTMVGKCSRYRKASRHFP